MKWLLNLFPRTLLIQTSILLRPFLRWYYKGTRFTDPIDGSQYRKFLPYGYQKTRPNALCPGTLSLERHRLLWVYLDQFTNLLTEAKTVLHVAPEQAFYNKFKTLPQWDYTTTDLESPLADVKADLCDLPFENEQFDVVFCNHVLEHIPDDHKALQELYRILKKGGIAFLQVPLNQQSEQTDEDPLLTNRHERIRRFGQYDHVRYYGKDFSQRLEKVGFTAEYIDVGAKLSPELIKRYALPHGEWLPIGRKA